MGGGVWGSGDSIVAYIGSLIGLVAFLRGILPREVRDFLREAAISFLPRLYFLFWTSKTRIDVHEWAGSSPNEMYDLVHLHVAELTSASARTASTRRLDLVRVKNSAKPSFALASGESVRESFRGVSFWWTRRVIENSESRRWSTRRSYTLEVDTKLAQSILPSYLEHVVKNAEEVQHRNRKRKLFTNFSGWEYRKRPWMSVPFDHPATFESMAMDPELKQQIMDDLRSFMGGEAYFRKIGRAWKRGYLLHGPPGTGKSSLIAAIAHFTGYDIYDLELTDVKNNSNLRKYLTAISNKAIVVIEDIDCSLDLKKRPGEEGEKKKKKDGGESDDDDDDDAEEDEKKSKVTLSGLLNFTDGLWSSTGSERILIFTTNHIDQLDPALIRSGRMDMHICLSYCAFPAFKVLARTHLDVEDHRLFPRIEELIGEVQVTPAEIAELLIQNRNHETPALESVIAALEAKKKAKLNSSQVD
ncbi:AAA-ATPase At4g30250 [Selaginella moellendorffii]|nr:AAA-ATPase At4g30250 [Selaginella moellendorffii]|eukprot:XP_002967144.2 AAA-ATPase At4g30250 [Selaginella moellendorffii]